jgi:uncharacterized protein YbjT (DUF2867 family)
MGTSLRVVVFGPTGTAGSEVVRQCIQDPRIAEVRAITRRQLEDQHEKLRVIQVQDVGILDSALDALTGVDACFFCLGISQSQAQSESHYRAVTIHYPVHAADVLRERSPDHTFVYLSGQGADPVGRSWAMWARVKGEAETELARLQLRRLFCFRPGYIHPEPGHEKSGVTATIARALYPAAKIVLPGATIRASELGRAMIEAVVSEAPGGVLENPEILALARKYSSATRET